ncbi:alpha/beta-hydrolase [Lentinula aff. lateritia]|uniref:Alpha/beta-hydrolase n=1 Tax=Lentinula aff. lateritia TaxID=2804960 RepID=A0ACC1TJ28_9AGAR|nr:alpha/beta-hydrolase [Lentinula aff. lateritia]
MKIVGHSSEMTHVVVKTTYHVDNRPFYPLQILSTRYQKNKEIQRSGHGYTLILLHATGMHKETWEVFVKHLFELSLNHPELPIEDIFSIESPNHGESAVINEQVLKTEFEDKWSPREYGRAVHTFLTSGPTTVGINFTDRRLVAICHSVGAPALFLMDGLIPKFKFISVIAIEPGVSLKGNPETDMVTQMLTAWTWLRHDVWPSRKAAKKDLQVTPLYATWDPQVLDLYIRHGLRPHSASRYIPPFQFNGVTTALTKEQEAATYRSDELVVDALEAYSILTRNMPVHLIWGRNNNVATPELQELLADKTAGRFPRSISYVENAGHLAVQQQPFSVAQLVLEILCRSLTQNKL